MFVCACVRVSVLHVGLIEIHRHINAHTHALHARTYVDVCETCENNIKREICALTVSDCQARRPPWFAPENVWNPGEGVSLTTLEAAEDGLEGEHVVGMDHFLRKARQER